MERNLERISDELKLPQESRERIRSQLASYGKQTEEIPMKQAILTNDTTQTKKRRFLPKAVGAIAAAAILCGSALAVSTGLDGRLLEFLGVTTAEQAEPLIAGAQVVNRTVKNAGSTLTVREVLGDKDNLYLLLNFTAPEGTALDAYGYRFQKDIVTLDAQASWQGIGYTKLEDDDPADNSLDLVMHITADSISRDGTITLRMGNLEAAAGFGEPYVPVDIPGEWKLRFSLQCADSSLAWETQTPVTLYGQEAMVTEVSLSPLSVTVKGNGETMDEVVEAARTSDVQGYFPVTIHFQDGTCLTTSGEAGDGYTTLVREGHVFYTNWTLHQIIDPNQVDHLIFGGTVIPVSQGQG